MTNHTPVIGFMALHYGLPYLDIALRSASPAVDKWVFAYSPIGSHGHRTEARCPDTEADLWQVVDRVLRELGKPYQWHNNTWDYEGAQRDSVFAWEPDAGLILVVDSDEVWAEGAAQAAVEQGFQATARHGHVRMWHFWRSFQYYCRDQSQPIRIIRPDLPKESGDWYADVHPVFHMGYAQPLKYIRYKMQVHGHKGEWREDWLRRYEIWHPSHGPWTDLHPTNVDFWKAESFVREQLPKLLQDHPYAHWRVIA